MRTLILIFILLSTGELLAQQKSVSKVKDFAIEYEPTPEEGKTVVLKPIPISISGEFLNLIESNQKYEEHLVLIFAKIYRYHLTCCHQSYELRNQNTNFITTEDPLVFELMKLTEKYTVGEHVEFLSSGIILNILDEQPELLTYEPLNNEFLKIRTIRKKIENGDF